MFHDVQFPPNISYGSRGGPKFKTSVIPLSSGYEQRNANWSSVRGEWNVTHGVKTRAQVSELIQFFYGRMGRAYAFRFKDWSDYQLPAHTLGTGDGVRVSFPLTKVYTSGPVTYTRLIQLPVVSTLALTVGGLPTVDWAMNPSYEVQFETPPAIGEIVALTDDAEFDVAARFDTDHMDVSLDDFDTSAWGSIPVVEVRL